MFQKFVGLGVLEVGLLFLRQFLCPADVPFSELSACGVQSCGDFLRVM